MRFSLFSFALGIGAYWAVQHFTGFGNTGPYERLHGKVHFAIDPAEPNLPWICDLDLAPRNAQGLVEFAATMDIVKPVGLWGAYVMGLAFAFGWTPCIGPVLGAILSLAATTDSVSRGMLLLGVYSAGLAVPFLLAAGEPRPPIPADRWSLPADETGLPGEGALRRDRKRHRLLDRPGLGSVGHAELLSAVVLNRSSASSQNRSSQARISSIPDRSTA